ncbi:hypothetical protein R2TS_14470 [Enterobacter asburiae]|nr:hypothetical protein R2TS_14470 [Enterobacter asburiae]
MPDALTPALSHGKKTLKTATEVAVLLLPAYRAIFYYAKALAIFSYRSPDRFSSPFSCSSAARIFA